jgi:hypothetical protein
MPTRLIGRKSEAARRRAIRSLTQISDEEDARLTMAAAADPDNPTIDEAISARLRPAAEVSPELVRRARAQRCGS